MPEFELDLTNVESEVVDGVTVIKAAELTAVSLVGSVAPGAAERITAWAQPVSTEEAGANFREAIRKLQRHEGNTTEEMRQAGDGIRAVAAQIAEEAECVPVDVTDSLVDRFVTGDGTGEMLGFLRSQPTEEGGHG